MPITKPAGQWLDPGYIEVLDTDVTPVRVSGTLRNFTYPLVDGTPYFGTKSRVLARSITSFPQIFVSVTKPSGFLGQKTGVAKLIVKGSLSDAEPGGSASWDNITESEYNALTESEYNALPETGSSSNTWNNITESEYNALNEPSYNAIQET